MSELKFDDLLPKEMEFTYAGIKYVLTEASEAAAMQLRAGQFKNARMVDGKIQAEVGDMSKSQALLVSLCLFQAGPPRTPVSVDELRKWPTRVVKKYFTWIMEVSELNEGETADVLQKRLFDDRRKLAKLVDKPKLATLLEQLMAENSNGHDSGEDAAKNAPAAGAAISA